MPDKAPLALPAFPTPVSSSCTLGFRTCTQASCSEQSRRLCACSSTYAEEQEIKSSKFTSYQNQILFYQFLESCTLDWNTQQNLSFQCFLLYIVRGKNFPLHFNVCECCLSCAIEPIAAWEKSCCAHTTGFRSKVISMINIDGISNTNFKELCWLIVWCPKEICKHCWQNILSGYVQTPMTDPMRQHA